MIPIGISVLICLWSARLELNQRHSRLELPALSLSYGRLDTTCLYTWGQTVNPWQRPLDLHQDFVGL